MTKYIEIPNKLELLKEIRHDIQKRLVSMELDARNIKREQFKNPNNLMWQQALNQLETQRRTGYDVLELCTDEIIEKANEGKNKTG